MSTILEVNNVSKVYKHRDGIVHAIKDVSFSIEKGDFVTITGPSGSGKTTLLLALGGLIRTSSGSIMLEGKKIHCASDGQLSEIRKKHMGFVMQNFSLIPYMTAFQNVMIPLGLNGIPVSKQKETTTLVLELVGLADRMNHFPRELSAGQQQRVAIARALVNQPSVIFADEPTGNLDPALTKEILDFLQDINHKQKITMMMVTHSNEAAKYGNVNIKLKEGIINQINKN